MRIVENALGSLIAQAIDDQHLTIQAAADRCGIGLGLMSNILYGKTRTPRPKTLASVARGLGLSYSRLALAAYGVIHEPVPA